jgi:4-hydroxythreonine-4-phosphate dehydrogenase
VSGAVRAALAVSVGCPAGIGPEVALAAAAKDRGARCVLVGDVELLRTLAAERRIARRRLVELPDSGAIGRLTPGQIGLWAASAPLGRAVRPGRPNAAAGAAQLRWIDQACALVAEGHCQALVTAPAAKATIASSGAAGARRFRGHTEHLARRLGVDEREVGMAFAGGGLTTALCTTHLPLARVPRALSAERVATVCLRLAELLGRLGCAHPQIAVAGLNPHAGEGGLLGGEEQRIITPGIRLARRRASRRGARLHGPLGAETAFRLAAAGELDGVVAMYHDQATIAAKLMGFGDSVNVTLGLPIVRTSVDHGTAYDLAGRGRASPRAMRSALALALRLAGSSGTPSGRSSSKR